MAGIRNRKKKEKPHYGFLVSWAPNEGKTSYVKRESNFDKKTSLASNRHGKNADSLAQAEADNIAKKGIIRSLIHISLILILELMVYLAWNKFSIQ